MSPTLLLTLLPALISAATEITGLVQKIIGELKQSSELTSDQEAALDAHIASLENQVWWQPDNPTQ